MNMHEPSLNTKTITQERTEERLSFEDVYDHRVILYNDDFNSFDHVENCLMTICFKTSKQAQEIALEAHNNGKAVCYNGSMEVCETVAEKMGDENLTVSLE